MIVGACRSRWTIVFFKSVMKAAHPVTQGGTQPSGWYTEFTCRLARSGSVPTMALTRRVLVAGALDSTAQPDATHQSLS